MKIWITKNALTKGIKEVDAEIDEQLNLVTWKVDRWKQYAHCEGRDWHRTHESSVARAEEMRTQKLASLGRQIEKLKKMEFK